MNGCFIVEGCSGKYDFVVEIIIGVIILYVGYLIFKGTRRTKV